jgi:hypothetical protein
MSDNDFLDITAFNIAAAKEFLLQKWKLRWHEKGAQFGCYISNEGENKPLIDLSGACKFSSYFAVLIFNGELKGNFFHQWMETLDGTVVDLNEDAADVVGMKAGIVPLYARAYASAMGVKLPKSVYVHKPSHMKSKGNIDSMISVQYRVAAWASEFKALIAHQNTPYTIKV